jgi:hypothetical protein
VYCLFKFLIASFAFDKNSGWLDTNTHSQNAIHCSPFWNKTIPHANQVCVAYPWTSTPGTPLIQGLPIDIICLAKVEELKLITHTLQHENKCLEEGLTHKSEEQLDLRSVGNKGYGLSRKINCKFEELLERASNLTALPLPHHQDADALGSVVDGICMEIDYG